VVEFVADGADADSQEVGGAGAVAVDLLERRQNHPLFHFLQGQGHDGPETEVPRFMRIMINIVRSREKQNVCHRAAQSEES
jgi:hypothetical protein